MWGSCLMVSWSIPIALHAHLLILLAGEYWYDNSKSYIRVALTEHLNAGASTADSCTNSSTRQRHSDSAHTSSKPHTTCFKGS
jgi:hypothetical protein